MGCGKVRKWYKPKGHTGWSKNQSSETRRRKLLNSTSKRMSMHNRYLQAARKINALANVSRDPETKKKAREDADYFFDKLK